MKLLLSAVLFVSAANMVLAKTVYGSCVHSNEVTRCAALLNQQVPGRVRSLGRSLKITGFPESLDNGACLNEGVEIFKKISGCSCNFSQCSADTDYF